MNLYKFITHEEIEMMAESIKNKVDFDIKREYEGHFFRIHSSRALTDFGDGTREGDYIIGASLTTSTGGWGRPISGGQLKELEDVNKLKKYIDKKLGESRIDGYEPIGEGQINLFEMMI